VIGSALVLTILQVWDLAVVVDGRTTCPSPDAVKRELEELMPPDGEPREPDLAELSREGADLHLELRRGDGSWVAVRDIAGGRGCDDLATAVAVVIAAWEAELASGVSETVSLAPPAPPVIRRRSRRFGAAALLAMAPPGPSRSALPAIVNPRPVPAGGAHAQPEFSVGLGGALSGGSLATGLVIDAFVRQAEGPLALRVGVELTTPHRNDLESGLGALEWRHFALDAGVAYRATRDDTFVDMHTELKLAALHYDFVDSGETVSATVPDFGLGTGVRLGFGAVGRRRVLPWVGLDVTVWGRRSTADTTTFSATVPGVDLGLAVGLTGGP
jgi:hypothetical protein